MTNAKRYKTTKWLIVIAALVIAFVFYSQGMSKEMPEAEKEYLDSVLSKITSESTRQDVIALLGEPDRDLGMKVNWMVLIDGNESRIGVYFDATTGKATRVNFDGGTGRFYYRRELN
ncbi:MAG TPA: hypothetical protein VEG39_01420 [Clostridia bacterium]|nr:hypothetical protein [Clostridia bacterium]